MTQSPLFISGIDFTPAEDLGHMTISSTGYTPMYYPTPDDKAIEDKFGLDLKKEVDCPVCGERSIMIDVLAHLNNKKGESLNRFDQIHDPHDWSFKQIGTWLKEIGY